MKKHFCDCCGEEYSLDSPHFKVFRPPLDEGRGRSKHSELIGMARNTDIVSKTFTHTRVFKFGVRVIMEIEGIVDADVCPNCMWSVLDKCDTRPHIEVVEDVRPVENLQDVSTNSPNWQGGST